MLNYITYISVCFPDLVIQDLNLHAGKYNRVYIDLRFTCHGYITEWLYYAHTAGSGYIDVFRPNQDGSFTLISKTKVTATTTGKQTHVISSGSHIEVQPGYVIGYHFQDAGAHGIFVEDNGSGLTVYSSPDRSDVRNTNDFYDAGLNTGSDYTPNQFYSKLTNPAITVKLFTCKYGDCLSNCMHCITPYIITCVYM